MLKDILTPDVVEFNVDGIDSPEEAIRFSGKLLEKSGKIKNSYVEKMVDSFHELGPYSVIAPGIALPHATPSGDVLVLCLSFVQLKHPISFGHPDNDPVKIIFAIAGVGHGEHLELLQSLSALLGNADKIEKLKTISSFDELQKLL